MTKIIGLTGGIGSGKTMIANYIKSQGFPVYIADDEARNLMKSEGVINEIRSVFGAKVFDKGILNREKLALIVFNNPEDLKKLNHIIHPLVKKHFDEWVQLHKNYAFVIKESAILFESESSKCCDKIITVVASLETRIQRLIKRDKTSNDDILNRMKNQWTDEERAIKSDYIIHNDSVKETQKQTNEILKSLEKL